MAALVVQLNHVDSARNDILIANNMLPIWII